MRNQLKKIERLDPVIEIKQKRVDEEASFLGEIRREKAKMESDLVSWQQRYLDGVARLNVLRESGNRSMLAALESAIDHARETLFSLFQRLKEVDGIEAAQMIQLNMAQRELSAVERLQEVYRQRFRKDLGRKEQKGLDEIALRRFLQSRG